MVRTAIRLAALGLVVASLSGCVVGRRVVPMDASGMELPAKHFAEGFHDQVRRSREGLAAAPGALAKHVRDSWDRLWHER